MGVEVRRGRGLGRGRGARHVRSSGRGASKAMGMLVCFRVVLLVYTFGVFFYLYIFQVFVC